MRPPKRDLHIVEMLFGFLLIVLVGAVMWWLVGMGTGGPLGSSASGQKTQVPALSQLPQPPATVMPEPYPALESTATQNAIATIVAFKQAGATAAIIEMTTSPFPTDIPNPGEISGLEQPEKDLLARLGLNVQNAWTGNINGRNVVVYVGAEVANPDEGGILVMWSGPQQTLQQSFTIPGKHGSLKVSAEKNKRLTLASADNATFYFDVPGLRLANSLTEIVPTVDLSQMVTLSTPGVPVATPVTTAYP